MDLQLFGVLAFLVTLFGLEHGLRQRRPHGFRPSSVLAGLALGGQKLFRFLGVCFAYLLNAGHLFWRWILPQWLRLYRRVVLWIRSMIDSIWRLLAAFERFVRRLWRKLLRTISNLVSQLRALLLRVLDWIPWQEIRRTAADLIVPVWDLLTSPVFFVVGYLDVMARLRAWWKPLCVPVLVLIVAAIAWVEGFSWKDLSQVQNLELLLGQDGAKEIGLVALFLVSFGVYAGWELSRPDPPPSSLRSRDVASNRQRR